MPSVPDMKHDQGATPLEERDYEAIEAAVMETARGRWFLKEYARRNRAADTDMLLSAIDRLEHAVPTAGNDTGRRIADDLTMIGAELARVRTELDNETASRALDGLDKRLSVLMAAYGATPATPVEPAPDPAPEPEAAEMMETLLVIDENEDEVYDLDQEEILEFEDNETATEAALIERDQSPDTDATTAIAETPWQDGFDTGPRPAARMGDLDSLAGKDTAALFSVS